MDEDELRNRLDYVEAELISAGDIDARLRRSREVIELLHGIVSDLVANSDDAAEYEEDLEQIAGMLPFL
ncbi:hypothetical protein [Pseudoclavibacter helvolus]|uniref:hypothetical protein n=1 Tax=Pseudoclavibacter helvolus TaxID=255205 RepID=UPI000837B56E|nr:hypothetical protein [Pseudoclavibacter helvolus]